MNPLTIIKFIRDNSLTKEEFCKKCNITIDILDNIIYYGTTIEFKIAERISDAMGIGVYELYIY